MSSILINGIAAITKPMGGAISSSETREPRAPEVAQRFRDVDLDGPDPQRQRLFFVCVVLLGRHLRGPFLLRVAKLHRRQTCRSASRLGQALPRNPRRSYQAVSQGGVDGTASGKRRTVPRPSPELTQ